MGKERDWKAANVKAVGQRVARLPVRIARAVKPGRQRCAGHLFRLVLALERLAACDNCDPQAIEKLFIFPATILASSL
jgi:hypothetical protein